MSWRLEAACRGMDPTIFYPEVGASISEAKAVCDRCPVALECREAGVRESMGHGVWGGLPPRARRGLRSTLPSIGSRPVKTSAPCGSSTRYRAGCRCLLCREAWRLDSQRWRASGSIAPQGDRASVNA